MRFCIIDIVFLYGVWLLLCFIQFPPYSDICIFGFDDLIVWAWFCRHYFSVVLNKFSVQRYASCSSDDNAVFWMGTLQLFFSLSICSFWVSVVPVLVLVVEPSPKQHPVEIVLYCKIRRDEISRIFASV